MLCLVFDIRLILLPVDYPFPSGQIREAMGFAKPALECATEGVTAEKIRTRMCLNNWYRNDVC